MQNKIKLFTYIPKTENTYIPNHTFNRLERRYRYEYCSPGVQKKKNIEMKDRISKKVHHKKFAVKNGFLLM